MNKNKKKFVKTDSGYSTGLYNINTYNAFDAVMAFIITVVSAEIVGILFNIAFDAYAAYYTYSYYFVLLLSTVLMQVLIFAIGFIYSKARHVGYLNGGGFVFRFDWVNIIFACMLVIGMDLFLSAVHLQFGDDLLRLFFNSDIYNFGTTPTEPEGLDVLYAYVLSFILVPVLPCIFEEGLFRGVILRGLSEYGQLFAIIVSAMMFSFMHGNPTQILLQFCFGLIVASIVILTKNFAVGCAMHFISNFMVVRMEVLAILSDTYIHNGGYLFDALSIIIGTVFLLVSIIYFFNMFIAKYKRKVLNKPEKQSYADLTHYALIDSGQADENGEKIFVKTYRNEDAADIFALAGKTFSYKGKLHKVNKPSKYIFITKLLIVVSLCVSLILIFVI